MYRKIIAMAAITVFVHPLIAQLDSGATSQGSVQSSSNGTSGSTNVQASTTIVVIGGVILILGIPLSIVSTTVRNKQKEKEQVASFMRQNHNELIHDVSIGSGSLLKQIAFELGLNGLELGKINARLAGSMEQKEILKTLDGEIDTEDAMNFSQNLSRVFMDALGKNRITEVIKKSWGETEK